MLYTLDPDQQKSVYRQNQIIFMLYSTESLSAENFTPDVSYDYFADIGEYCPRWDIYGRPSISQIGTYM